MGKARKKNRTLNFMEKQTKNIKRLKLTIDQTISHYMIVFIMLFPFGLFSWNLFKIFVTKDYNGVSSTQELIIQSVLFLTLAIIFAIIQFGRLYLKEIKINYTEEQFQDAVKRTFENNDWRIGNNNKNLFKAYIPTGLWGYSLTIIKYKDRLLINSICDPNGRMSTVFSFGKNKKYIRTFTQNLTDSIQEKPLKQKPEGTTLKKEWSVKMTTIRIFAYPFCLFLLVFGFYTILNPLTTTAIFVGIGLITVATIFLYSDLKILTRKSKHESPSP
jgi:hypothetical protein